MMSNLMKELEKKSRHYLDIKKDSKDMWDSLASNRLVKLEDVKKELTSAREELLNNAWCCNCGNLVMRGLMNKCRCSNPILHVSIGIINSVLGDGKE